MPEQRLRVLILTNLFPSTTDPGFAPFNRQQFLPLGRMADVDVYGVIPWRFTKARGPIGAAPARERIGDLTVYHPRFPSVPGLPSLNAAFLASSLFPEVLRRRWRYDVILASYAYPDGVAGVILGQTLRLPVVVKCHGSDLNRIPNDPPARFQLKTFLPRAEGVVVVSKKLGEAARGLGVPPERLHVVYNGIDRDRFAIVEKKEARERLGLPPDGEVVVSVGQLAEHKGTLDLLAAVPLLALRRPKVIVAFVGDGPLRGEVAHHAEHGAVGKGRVLSVGRVGHDEVPTWMSAADVVCLPSWDEGLPNVVREAHAVGRPVVATAVGGVPEAITSPELGRLVQPKRPEALAEALAEALSKPSAPAEEIARIGRVESWDQSAEQLHAVLEKAVVSYRARHRRLWPRRA